MTQQKLAKLLAGPIVRRCTDDQLNFWLVTDRNYQIELTITCDNDQDFQFCQVLTPDSQQTIQIGERAFVHLLTPPLEYIVLEQNLNYQLSFYLGDDKQFSLSDITTLHYGDKPLSFVVKTRLNKVLHGSCRKPHFDSEDALIQVDEQIKASLDEPESRPALLMMSGDQVYCDDVCGPMLNAVHQVIDLLGLYQESWQVCQSTTNNAEQAIKDSSQLFASEQGYYQRHLFLPQDQVNHGLWAKLFGASKQPIFTSVNAKNHLVTAAEVFAQYLLTWSPALWQSVDLDKTDHIPTQFLSVYHDEKAVLERFISGLGKVQRALAHIPTYMIFDDHDVTDDWNLTRAWEESAYQNAFSKRIIGNALFGYLLFQGWGNAPDNVKLLIEQIPEHFGDGVNTHDELIDALLDFDQWHYHLNSVPKMVVLDTRTSRWRSESFAGKPSGLMDWESLCEMQQELIDQPSVILVSAAPIYGVKLIETIQRIFTFFGKPLMVDAENWMAHSGTANVMLNIFRHYKTPPNFIILSGDVHYSFVYEVEHRFIRTQSSILQVTCSGIKNEFPARPLSILAKLNTVLYAAYSPLNWFTKRRRMKILARKPSVKSDGRLVNQSGIGLLNIESEQEIGTQLLTAKGEVVDFIPRAKTERD
ncbi:alkaline phosphatase family protein [Thalassotalea sp. LPB0316]|uniref:alkaline phosphatase D family protein n=1 Tax=Thalassotalea sp. LPB0316 TaxID=2769490 RepID=UPI001866C7DF|nr:alkaline phosphatase D family protein [Thalassotalea sp. LPB0316]QOL25984.1 alkaline phosphatase family protein [Thalassotalea sp. LPB0316]